jgi:hypothetical protein
VGATRPYFRTFVLFVVRLVSCGDQFRFNIFPWNCRFRILPMCFETGLDQTSLLVSKINGLKPAFCLTHGNRLNAAVAIIKPALWKRARCSDGAARHPYLGNFVLFVSSW